MLHTSDELKGNLLQEAANIVSLAFQFGLYNYFSLSAHSAEKFTLENRTMEWALGQPAHSFARVFVLHQLLLQQNTTSIASSMP